MFVERRREPKPHPQRHEVVRLDPLDCLAAQPPDHRLAAIPGARQQLGPEAGGRARRSPARRLSAARAVYRLVGAAGVVGLVAFEGRGRDGLEVRRQTGAIHTLRDGLVTRIENYEGWAEALEAVGLAE